MKSLSLCLVISASCLFCMPSDARAQTAGVVPASSSSSAGTTAAGVVAESNPPDLVVVKFSWSKERLGWERDPFSGPVENFDEMRVRSRNEKRIDDAKRGGAPEVDRIKREAKADSANLEQLRRQRQPPRYGFMYKVSLRNTGAKAIKSLDWDHVFFDADTKAETGRHQFTSDEKIAPGKQKEFSVFASSPPTSTISVHKLEKREREIVGEAVVVVRVEYADGSVWRRP
ncbi:MAG: hypothetical protein QOD32_169 [Pyrinomonadaceae bacterium]|jgi:hypothetical protein|nr:hypothetical protein [Pyrinomonadaceae bacterium]